MENTTVSYWHKTAGTKKYVQLKNNLEVDNLIVGGGITGVTTAYCLAQKGFGSQTVLIEGGQLCDGATGNTTAKITVQHDYIYSRLLKEQGFPAAKMYYQAQESAVDFVKNTIKKEKIECNYMGDTGYIYAVDVDESQKVEKEFEAAMRLEIPAKFFTKPPFPRNCVSMTAFFNQGVFHPIKYVNALAAKAEEKGVRIYCLTRAAKVEEDGGVTVSTENGVVIKAKNLIVATQYPFYDGNGLFFTKLYGKRGYATAAITEKDFPDGSYKKSNEPTRSLRKCYQNDECVAIAQGETHYTGRSGDMESHFKAVFDFLQDEVGINKEVAKWSLQDYDTPDGIAYIGRLSKKSHVYVGTGYGRWGMSNGTLAGLIISDMIAAGGNRFEELFSPMRKEKVSPAVNMAGEVSASVGELLKSKVEHPKNALDICPGEGRVIIFNGEKAGIYVDENRNAVILDIACAHLSTILNFNSAEKTWDCPAHASRYSCDGLVLEGVAKKPLKVLYKGKLSDLKVSDEGSIIFEEN